MSIEKSTSIFKRHFSTSNRSSSEQKCNFSREFFCQLCEKEFVDPRVLPCLHCFCSQCLHKLDSEQNSKVKNIKPSHTDWFHGILVGYLLKDNCIRGEYVRVSTSPDEKTFEQNSHQSELKCPICGYHNKLPPKGVQDLPPHYLLQHRMLVNSLNKGKVNFLCDLCPSETPAISRCTKCLLNLCHDCSKSHKREKLFPEHEFTKLKRSQPNGSLGITKISRQVMCPSHCDSELKYYCSSCSMVACNECRIHFHSNHKYEPFSKAAEIYISKIRDGLEKTRSINKITSAAIDHLNSLSQQFESKYSQVQTEINAHIDCYVEAFEIHRKSLLAKASEIKCEQMECLDARRKELLQRARDISHILKFGEDLLSEGSDFEILSFAFYLLQRLEWCIKFGNAALTPTSADCFGTLHFFPAERSGTILNKSVFGVVTAQVVSPTHCHITSEALEALKNCREKQRCELTLVTKDNYDQRLTHGAEGIEVSLKNPNNPNRHIPICIIDQQNGVYLISFTPDHPGYMSLSVSIRGVPIKGSPFSVVVRAEKAQGGTLHCCIFCSGRGSQNTGYNGRRPGYHGCAGKYGEGHWSCCKNPAKRESECLQTLSTDNYYQLNL